MFARLLELDERLVARGWPALSPWWKEQLRRLYASGKRRLVIRAGRRGGKSSTLCRVAVCEALYGQHDIPPGDVGVFAFFSVSMREARERLRTISEILEALDVPFERSGDSVRIAGRAVCIRVYPASVRTAVGFTCIGAAFDELARWRDEATGANPATEVLRSVRPAMATQRQGNSYPPALGALLMRITRPSRLARRTNRAWPWVPRGSAIRP